MGENAYARACKLFSESNLGQLYARIYLKIKKNIDYFTINVNLVKS